MSDSDALMWGIEAVLVECLEEGFAEVRKVA